MKLNGALKPRQGASNEGSSPGAVLRKYRDKRYSKVNENVVNDLPLNECGGVNINNNNNNNNNDNNQINNNNNNQHHQQQQEQKKCSEYTTNILFSPFSIYYNTNNKNSKNINNTQYRTKTVEAAAAAENIDYNSHGSRKGLTTAATAATTVKVAQEKENHNVVKEIVQQKQNPVNNITTRQVNRGNNRNGKKTEKEEQKEKEEIVEFLTTTTTTTSNNSKYHVTSTKTSNNISNILYCKEVNKFLLISKIYENLILCALTFLTVIISQLFIQFKLLLFLMFAHTKAHLPGYPAMDGGSIGGGGVGGRGSSPDIGSGGFSRFSIVGNNSAKIMRASKSFMESFDRICFKNVNKSRLPPSIALCMLVYAAAAILLPQPVLGDDGDNFYPINGLETTTPEFDYASRGQKKFGDKCDNTLECGFPGSICDPKKKSCQCTEDLPVTNHIDKCGKEAAVNESCFFNEQCEVKYFQTECRDQRCVCRFDMSPIWLKDGTVECKGRGEKKQERYIDPAMIGVLIGMALMFIIICVVLRLFSQARWRENRTIFNTPNPRLMNVSLLRESKLLHGQERRGSRMSVRAPSRQPSMASLRPHSPNPSLGKTGSRSNSHGSNASATSLRSTRSNSVSPAGIVVNNSHHERKGSTYQPHHHHHHHSTPHPQHQQPAQQQQQHQPQDEEEREQQQPLTQTNITSNPVAESVTVEIIVPEK